MRRNLENRDLYIALLAAGKAKRMNSGKSKVLHEICGKPLLHYPLEVAKSLNPKKIFVVIGGPYMEQVKEALKGENVQFVIQEEPLGTGDAVKRVQPYIDNIDSDLMVLPGDAPLLRIETARELLEFHRSRGAIATVLTAELPDPTGYGRIVRSIGDRIMMIVEEVDAFPEEKEIKEVNSGIYLFDTEALFEWLHEIRADNRQGEYYLTDVIEILQRRVGNVYAHKITDWEEILGINTRKQLSQTEKIMEKRIKNYWMDNGVTFLNPELTYVESDVYLEKDVIIYPFVSLMGKTYVESGARIGPNVVIKNTRIKKGSIIIGPKFIEGNPDGD